MKTILETRINIPASLVAKEAERIIQERAYGNGNKSKSRKRKSA